MIIKKSRFKLTPGFNAKDWPFSVAEVGISIFNVDGAGTIAYVLLHDGVNYALSGIMESHGLPKLEESGIWSDKGPPKNNELAFKKSLSPIFKYLDFLVKGK